MNVNQQDLVKALKGVDLELANHVRNRFEAGETFDQVQSSLKLAFETVSGWRIGRGV